MPLLMCPNDNGAMQTMQRGGVEFDMCPTCRGVWLDRGELEKLMDSVRAADSAPHTPTQSPYEPPRQQPMQGYGEQGERGEYSQGHDPRRQRRRGFDMFDIFD